MSDLNKTLEERGGRYGDFTTQAEISMRLKRIWRRTNGWPRLTDYQQQALDTIADKIARVLNGDPSYTDNWHDIAGYARLVEERLENANHD